MARRCGVPRISTGGRPSRVWMRAPIICSGTATRSIGRRISDSSPMSVESNLCGASTPIIRRIAVPALPMSSGAGDGARPCAPTPCTTTSVSAGRSIATPSCPSARAVDRQSSPARNPLMCVSPSASAPSMRARWEIDLSPGTVSEPLMLPPARTR